MSMLEQWLTLAAEDARKIVRSETGTHRWATVTSISPLRITYDGSTGQGIIPPVVLGPPVTQGDRVRAHTIGDKTYITRANPASDRGTVTPSGGVTGSIEWQVAGDVVQVLYDLTGAVSSDSVVGTLPSRVPYPAALTPAAEYTYGADARNSSYVDGTNGTVRVPAQAGVTRRRGSIMYLRSA